MELFHLQILISRFRDTETCSSSSSGIRFREDPFVFVTSAVRCPLRADVRVTGPLLALVLFVPGCSKHTGPARVPGGGRVELPNASPDGLLVNFFPKEGTAAPSASTIVRNGAYRFSADDGPVAGAYRVQFQRVSVRGKKPDDDARKPGAPVSPKDWEFEYVVPENGPFSKDFKLD